MPTISHAISHAVSHAVSTATLRPPRARRRRSALQGLAVTVTATIVVATTGITTTAHAARLELRLENVPGPFMPGASITIGVWMTDLDGFEAAGFQAFLEYDETALDFIGGVYTPVPFGLPILPIVAGPAGTLNLASGIDSFIGQPTTTADARLATLVFEASDTFCLPDLSFRAATPPTRITDAAGLPVAPLDLIVLEPACPGDFDFNGDTGFSDLLALLANFGGTCTGDFDQDGDVDFTDLVNVLATWGPCP